MEQIVEELKDVSRSYKEADMALEVGKSILCREENSLHTMTLGYRASDPSASGIHSVRCS